MKSTMINTHIAATEIAKFWVQSGGEHGDRATCQADGNHQHSGSNAAKLSPGTKLLATLQTGGQDPLVDWERPDDQPGLPNFGAYEMFKIVAVERSRRPGDDR